MNRWFAVSACDAVPPGHVAYTQLLGQELVLWRSAAGVLNAWENRCPHRGVRLTLGSCVGEELRCQYHAWRFASGSGQCTHIPSHPQQKPASTIRAQVFPLCEDGSFAWVNLTRDALPSPHPAASLDTALRSIFARAPVAAVRQVLLQGYGGHSVGLGDEFTLSVPDQKLQFMLQPVTEAQTIIHARLRGDLNAAERMTIFRHHNALLSVARDQAEAAA
jgi:nitrite reductase/ring-hydroxylating ferredoxin subunit